MHGVDERCLLVEYGDDLSLHFMWQLREEVLKGFSEVACCSMSMIVVWLDVSSELISCCFGPREVPRCDFRAVLAYLVNECM